MDNNVLLKILFWFFYLLSFPLIWYENYTIVCSKMFGPPVMRPAISRIALPLARLIFSYGSIIGIFWQHGVIVGLIALAVNYGFNKLSFKRCFSEQVLWLANILYEDAKEKATVAGETIDEFRLYGDSLYLAVQTVIADMKGGLSNPYDVTPHEVSAAITKLPRDLRLKYFSPMSAN